MIDPSSSATSEPMTGQIGEMICSAPITVTGVDARGQLFRERTSAHFADSTNCKYPSKHEHQQDSSVVLEFTNSKGELKTYRIQARVKSVQAAGGPQELFEIRAELETAIDLSTYASPRVRDTSKPFSKNVTAPSDAKQPNIQGMAPDPEVAAPSVPAVPALRAAKLEPPSTTNDPIPEQKPVQQGLEGKEFQGQIREMVREAAASTLSSQTAALLRELHASLPGSARQAVQAAADSYLADTLRSVLDARIEERIAAKIGSLLEQLLPPVLERVRETIEKLPTNSSRPSQERADANIRPDWAKAVEEAKVSLRDNAAEISKALALKMDQTGRRRLEEICDQTVNRMRNQISAEMTGATARLGEEIERLSRKELQRFTSNAQTVLQESTTQLKNFGADTGNRIAQSAEEFRLQVARAVQGSLAELQRNVETKIERDLARAREQFEMEPSRESLKQEQRAWLDELNRSAVEGAEQYKQKLENISNMWMVASAAALSENFARTIDQLCQAAEQRIQNTLDKVFPGFQFLQDSGSDARAPWPNSGPLVHSTGETEAPTLAGEVQQRFLQGSLEAAAKPGKAMTSLASNSTSDKQTQKASETKPPSEDLSGSRNVAVHSSMISLPPELGRRD